MRFGKSAAEAAEEQARQGSGSGNYIRHLKDGMTTFRILQEPDEWVYYWEHFNPGGFSFPCTNDRSTCPGCTSDVQKMAKASRKIAFNVLQAVNGTEYVNVYKVPNTLADKLKNRYGRIGSITDRDYTISKIKSGTSENMKVDYDLEGEAPEKIDIASYADQLLDVEQLLAEAYEESWGTPTRARDSIASAKDTSSATSLADKVAAAAAVQRQHDTDHRPTQQLPPPSEPSVENAAPTEGEEVVVTEDHLRGMEFPAVLRLALKEGYDVPEGVQTTDEVVDFMMGVSS